MTVLVLVGAFTLRVMGGLDGDSVSHGARQFQAILSAMRQRAGANRSDHGVVLGINAQQMTCGEMLSVRESVVRVTSDNGDASSYFPVEFLRVDEQDPRGDFDADTADVVLVRALVDHQWERWEASGRIALSGVRVRIPAGSSGDWYNLRPVTDDSTMLVSSDGPWSVIRVTTPLSPNSYLHPFPWTVAGPASAGASSLDLEFTTEPVPFSEPISLPAGVVIDLEWSSQSVRSLAEQNGAVQLMFSPRGNLVGPAGSLGALHFLLTDRQDAELLDDIDAYNNTTGQRKPDGLPDVPRRRRSPIDPRNRYPKTIVSVIPQSGAVLTSPIDPTDLIDNVTGESGPDGLADDLFRFARTGAGGP